MKKIKLLALSLLSIILTSCSSLEFAHVSNVRPVEGNVTTYLALTPVGLYNGNKGEDVASLFLENTIKFDAAPGSALPDKTKVTSSSKDVEFEAWISYNGQGTPDRHTTVPTQSGLIYYAFFKYVGDGQIDPPPPVTEAEWYIVGSGAFTNGGAEWSISSGIGMTVNTASAVEGVEYMALGVSFGEGDIWKLRDKSETATKWITSGWETNAGALKEGAMELVSDGYGGNNVKVNSAGRYDIYFKVYSAGGYSCYIGVSA